MIKSQTQLATELASARATGNQTQLADALHRLAVAQQRAGDTAQAQALYEECLALRYALGDRAQVVNLLNLLGLLPVAHHTQARARFAEAATLARAWGEQAGLARSLVNLGGVLSDTGDLATAQILQEESLALRRALGDQRDIAHSLTNLGDSLHRSGADDAARACLEESLAIGRTLADDWVIAGAASMLGVVAHRQGNYPTARMHFIECLRLAQKMDSQWAMGEYLSGLAGVAGAEGDGERAAHLAGAARSLLTACGRELGPLLQAIYDQGVAAAQAQLGAEQFGAAWAQAQAMPVAAVVAYATAPRLLILIGPERVGKSTVGKLLAARLGVPFTDLPKSAAPYYAELGHNQQAVDQAWDAGMEGFLHYQAPFEVHAVERFLQEQGGPGVLELGAIQVALPDDKLSARLQQALQPYQRIVLLLPSPDVEASVRVLDERGYVFYEGVELTEHFVRHHSNHDLAKIRLYTQGKTPAESCAELLPQLDPHAPEVFLIGPMGAGKSTLGKLLAEQLGRPQVSLDDIRWDYYKEIGYDGAVQREIHEREGFVGVYRYWKRFEIHAVERALQDHHGCVMDFGAGHSVQENAADFERIHRLLAPHPNVVLLLPSPDLDEAIAVLRERTPFTIKGVPFTRYLVSHPAFQQVATQVVFTQGKTPEEVCAEILGE